MGGELFDQELLEEVGDGADAGADGGGVQEDLADAAAVGGGDVEVGEAGGGERAEDGGVVGLPAVVVSLADDGVGDGVEDAGMDAASAFVVVAWVLLEDDGQGSAADEGAGEEAAIVGGEALCVAEAALSVAVEGVIGLLDAGGETVEAEGDGIDQRPGGEFELLPGVEGDGVGDVADVEVGKDGEDALLLLLVDLGLGDVGLGGVNLDVGG